MAAANNPQSMPVISRRIPDNARTARLRLDTWLFWCIAVIAGALDVWLLIGWREINPLDLSWLHGDAAQYEIGWEFLRHESLWTFPPTWLSRLDYPTGVSASNLDCIPLVGVLLRPLSFLLPENFQYLGLYAISCHVLQVYFGFRLVSLFANGDRVITLLGSSFFLLAPILTIRLHGHFSHSTQWIILACLYCYFKWPSADGSLRRYSVQFVVISMVAAAITPYMALIAVLFGLAALSRAYFENRRSTVHDGNSVQTTHKSVNNPPSAISAYFKWAALLALGTFSSLVVFGFVVMGHSQFAGDGYTDYSLNMLSPINPGYNALYFKALPVIGEGQRFEGYNYLGMGIILLLICFVARKPREIRKLWSPALKPLTILSIFLTILALSVRVTFADHTLFVVPLPKFLFNLLAAFRASGRLFWPVHYLLILAAIVGVVIAVPSVMARRLILVAALVIQYFDLLPMRDGVAAAAAHAADSNPLVSSDWLKAVRHHQHMVILPALQCGRDPSPGGLAAWPYFARLVARNGATLNSAYLGRIPPATLAIDCDSLPTEFLRDGPRRDTAYVLDDKLALSIVRRPRLSHFCRRVDGFNLCTYDPARSRESRELAPLVSH